MNEEAGATKPLSRLLQAMDCWQGDVMGCEPLQAAMERECQHVSGKSDRESMLDMFPLAYRCFPSGSFPGLIPDQVWSQLQREEKKHGPIFPNLADICNYCRVRLGLSMRRLILIVSEIEWIEGLAPRWEN